MDEVIEESIIPLFNTHPWTVAAAILVATVLILHVLLRSPPPPTTLHELSPTTGAIACGTGGYNVLTSVDLGVGGSTRGSKEAFTKTEESELVTVRVTAAGVNYADVCIRWGLYASWNAFGGGQRPGGNNDVPGFEFSGIVEAVGSKVPRGRFAVGDEVFGVTLFGGYSSRVVVPFRALFPRPPTLSLSEAAAFPCVALTAWFAIARLASPIAAGEWVLVHSAAGGVGSMLVQLARLQGWRVLGVVGKAHKVAACEALGADIVVDKSGKTSAALWAEIKRAVPSGFSAIFDANGVATLRQSFENLAPCGKLVVYGFHSMLPRKGGVLTVRHWLGMALDWVRTPRFNPLNMTATNRSVLAFNLSFLFARQDILTVAMDELIACVLDDRLVIPRVTEYAMEDVQKAHAALESGMTVGKLVLVVN